MPLVMRLDPEPFARMASGAKTLELRLYDDKRRQLKVGEELELCITDDSQPALRRRIRDMIIAPDFEQLLRQVSPSELGLCEEDIPALLARMHARYDAASIAKYGVVGIRLEPAS